MTDGKDSRIWISIKDGKMDIEIDMVMDGSTMSLLKMLLDFKGEFYPDGDDSSLLGFTLGQSEV